MAVVGCHPLCPSKHQKTTRTPIDRFKLPLTDSKNVDHRRQIVVRVEQIGGNKKEKQGGCTVLPGIGVVAGRAWVNTNRL